MDEYVALPQDHAESYHTFMHENLFRYIDILPENAHILEAMLLLIGLKTMLFADQQEEAHYSERYTESNAIATFKALRFK